MDGAVQLRVIGVRRKAIFPWGWDKVRYRDVALRFWCQDEVMGRFEPCLREGSLGVVIHRTVKIHCVQSGFDNLTSLHMMI